MGALETIEGNLRDAYKQLQSGTMLHVDQLMNERRDNPALRDQWFYTADGEVYFLDGARKTPMLAMTREAHNPVLQNIDDAFEQLANKHNYRVGKADEQQALTASDTMLIVLSRLRLQGNNAERQYLEFGTPSAYYSKLNDEERKFAERVYGQGDNFVQNMEMLKEAKIREARIWVLHPEYVRERAEEGAIARASWFDYFSGNSPFSAVVRNFGFHGRFRGVRRGSEATRAPVGRDESEIEPPGQIELPTREQILSILRPYIADPLWEKAKRIVPENAPVFGDILQRLTDERFLADHPRNFCVEALEKIFPKYHKK